MICKIAQGVIAGVDAGIQLTAQQCIEIRRQAIVDDYYYQAIDWMETAINKIRLQNDTTASLVEAETQLETAKKVVRSHFILNSNHE